MISIPLLRSIQNCTRTRYVGTSWQNYKELMTLKELPKNPTIIALILVQGLEGLSVVNVETREDGRNSTSGAIILEKGTTKFHILDVVHSGSLQDCVRIAPAKSSVEGLNRGVGKFSECVASSRVRRHQTNGSNPLKGGGFLQQLKKGGSNVTPPFVEAHNELGDPTNCSTVIVPYSSKGMADQLDPMTCVRSVENLVACNKDRLFRSHNTLLSEPWARHPDP